MPSLPQKDLLELDVEYAAFNASRTMGDARESSFERIEVGPLTVTRDRARPAAYYNRILGCTPDTLSWLDRALEHFEEDGHALRVDLDIRHQPPLDAPLRDRGFVSDHELLWLAAGSLRPSPSWPVVRLGPEDADRLLPLLELQVSITPDLWKLRRRHHCTDRFRAFVVEEDGELVAMATTFVGERGTLLGNGFTRAEWRGRGCQSALIAARLADADALGSSWVVTDVEPGTASHRNCERAGFEVVQHQAVWERAP